MSLDVSLRTFRAQACPRRRIQCSPSQLGVKNLTSSRQETSKNLAKFSQV